MAKVSKKIAVIGGGWAGCAAAVTLTQNGHQVSLFESAKTLGGRARGVGINGLTVDNGQHILLGAYQQSLKLMKTVGVDLNAAFLRLPLQMIYPEHEDGMHFIAPRLPAPLHMLVALWRATGLRREDKLALARFSSAARWMGWTLNTDCTVAELLQRFDQTDRLCRLMWNPLCIAALNTPAEQASAQVFLNVLRDSLGASRAASDMLLPRLNLSALFPQKAAEFIQRHGADVACSSAIKAIKKDGASQWIIESVQQNEQAFDGIVIATDASNAQRLLSDADTGMTLPPLTYEAITSCYLQYAPGTSLPRPMYALLDDPSQQQWGQYVFDRGQLHDDQSGLFAVVISAPKEHQQDHQSLASAIARQLADSFQRPELASPLWHQIITEKRATFSCTPALQRPSNSTGIPGLTLAGDYTQGGYPATLEGAISSGIHAATEVINSLRR
ncbi:hydroxysqualene dehydroxylase HpnE [Undibacterium sp. CY21W]|uniref:hydroxysqualene dehydroxylase HpnE n=1 Tax=Undibacterium sp. CY21W TaxID=2762293 RepID=UPI00164B0AF1|nr:hydroxysqualene dehydroxylase HpnE [Undibacterium sp. CY21W]MBC3929841.1 FAD-dependent oxidoreductase [Undibacterium sp. CY21W]